MSSSNPYFISVMKGCPDILFLQKFLRSYGFSDISVQPRLETEKQEKPQDYLSRFFKNLNINTFGLAFTVACGQRILGIPSTAQEAKSMLQLLSGRRHQIWGAFGVKLPDRLRIKILSTRVSFKVLTSHEIDTYLETEGWCQKSGGYSFHDPNVASFIKSINGPPGLLSGLPFYEFYCFMQTYDQLKSINE